MLNTSHKIFIARLLCRFVMTSRRLCGRSANVIKKRGGIIWALDLKEGIDLAIYMFGGFEVRTLRMYQRLIEEGSVVLDIGANIGAHTLPLAKLVGDNGRVIAFEPTQYAFNKLQKNISLNLALFDRITAHQTMLMNSGSEALPTAIYSSWPLENASDLHKEHHGRLMSTENATVTTLDCYTQSAALQRLDFIKLDVDGNEYDVLISGRETLKKFKPTLIMELAPYVYAAEPAKFDQILQLLWDLNYEIADVMNGKHLPHNPIKIRNLIPLRGGMNIIAKPE